MLLVIWKVPDVISVVRRWWVVDTRIVRSCDDGSCVGASLTLCLFVFFVVSNYCLCFLLVTLRRHRLVLRRRSMKQMLVALAPDCTLVSAVSSADDAMRIPVDCQGQPPPGLGSARHLRTPSSSAASHRAQDDVIGCWCVCACVFVTDLCIVCVVSMLLQKSNAKKSRPQETESLAPPQSAPSHQDISVGSPDSGEPTESFGPAEFNGGKLATRCLYPGTAY